MSRIYIDVGGILYVSTKDSLFKSSVLRELILKQEHAEDNNIIFVDRDGSAFYYILTFLRSNTIAHVDPSYPYFIKFLIQEAEFYKLNRMVKLLTGLAQ